MQLIINGSVTFQQLFTTMTIVITTAKITGHSSVFASASSEVKYSNLTHFKVPTH